MRETHRRIEDQEQDVSEDRATATKRESTRPSCVNQKLGRPWAENATHQKEQRSRREQTTTCGKNNRKETQASVFADNVLQLLTKLKANTVQAASCVKRQPLNFA